MKFEWTKENKKEIEDILTRYPTKKAALLPILHVAQEEFGWISPEVMEMVAQELDISPAHVYGVVTFYTMYNRKPVGKYHLQVCRTLSCAMMGSDRITSYIKKKLNINIGETTSDNRFTLNEVECLASCGTAPAMTINEKYFENLTEAELDKILESLE
ncbi:MAG: NADH-quinone oxidoreductase subunit NuoE [Deltaproteobacteria bacterium]|nr:MAG: NADH-quinone oxidoreductase subunit NuoE [Deltaproteobacteria bacterium]